FCLWKTIRIQNRWTDSESSQLGSGARIRHARLAGPRRDFCACFLGRAAKAAGFGRIPILMRNVPRVSCPLLLFLFLAIIARLEAQTITGSIRGSVSDRDGQPLPGTSVMISSDALIGRTRTTTTNEEGVFHFSSLPIGIYSVEARLEGFAGIRSNRV